MVRRRKKKKDIFDLKTPEEIEVMRGACQVTRSVLDALEDFVGPGISTEQINTFVDSRIRDAGAVPSPLNYKGFPKSVCTSLNDVICHGIPSSFAVLEEGDILNIDVTSYKDGFHGDASRMFLIGGEQCCSQEACQLVAVARQALESGIAAVRPGGRIGDIGAAIQSFITSTGLGYGIVREYTGHGVGHNFHEPPQVLHVASPGSGPRMQPGMTFTIEPMINQGTHKTVLSRVDGWTVRTADGKLSAQWEHTLCVTEDGCEILTG